MRGVREDSAAVEGDKPNMHGARTDGALGCRRGCVGGQRGKSTPQSSRACPSLTLFARALMPRASLDSRLTCTSTPASPCLPGR